MARARRPRRAVSRSRVLRAGATAGRGRSVRRRGARRGRADRRTAGSVRRRRAARPERRALARLRLHGLERRPRDDLAGAPPRCALERAGPADGAGVLAARGEAARVRRARSLPGGRPRRLAAPLPAPARLRRRDAPEVPRQPAALRAQGRRRRARAPDRARRAPISTRRARSRRARGKVRPARRSRATHASTTPIVRCHGSTGDATSTRCTSCGSRAFGSRPCSRSKTTTRCTR